MIRRIIEELKKKVHRKSGKKNNGKKVSRVLIAVPAYSHIENACVRSLFELEKPDGVAQGKIVSEDLDFCNKVKALGHKIYADVGLKCPHIGKVAF